MKVSAELIENLFELEGSSDDGWQFVDKNENGVGRWYRHHTMVVMDPEGNHWGIDYEVGNTENQEPKYPWMKSVWAENAPETVELYRVYPRIAQITVYTKEEFGGDRS